MTENHAKAFLRVVSEVKRTNGFKKEITHPQGKENNKEEISAPVSKKQIQNEQL